MNKYLEKVALHMELYRSDSDPSTTKWVIEGSSAPEGFSATGTTFYKRKKPLVKTAARKRRKPLSHIIKENLENEAKSHAIKKGLKLTNKRIRKAIETSRSANKIIQYHMARRKDA